MTSGHLSGTRWWQRGAVYQVYPRSCADHDGDGVGDLAGIEARLAHLVSLGVDAVWISPIYPSPMADFGYDVSDHCDVGPLFGTLGDLDRLLASAHEQGLRVLLDLVPGHTSDQHPWFVASRSSRHDPQRDWYVWRDAADDGGPPNNWVSEFGGPAWTLYVFEREHEGRRVAVALNLTDRSQFLPLEGPTMLSTTSHRPGPPTALAPNEGRIVALDDASGAPTPTVRA